MDVFAATSGPGLASSLMIGASIAKGLALGSGKPYLAINHLEGHLLSPFFGEDGTIEPNVALIVSGGHTLLVEVGAWMTIESSVGRWMMRPAKRSTKWRSCSAWLIRAGRDRTSGAAGRSERFDFPRSMLDSGDYNFSFSGLEDRGALSAREAARRDGAAADQQSDRRCLRFVSAGGGRSAWCGKHIARRQSSGCSWSR